jgi:hypothetical protein
MSNVKSQKSKIKNQKSKIKNQWDVVSKVGWTSQLSIKKVKNGATIFDFLFLTFELF